MRPANVASCCCVTQLETVVVRAVMDAFVVSKLVIAAFVATVEVRAVMAAFVVSKLVMAALVPIATVNVVMSDEFVPTLTCTLVTAALRSSRGDCPLIGDTNDIY